MALSFIDKDIDSLQEVISNLREEISFHEKDKSDFIGILDRWRDI